MANATVISVTNRKGGVGKTSLSCNLAVELVAMGKRVCVLDADPQGSATFWASCGEGVLSKIVRPVDASDAKKFRKALDEAKRQCDRVIVDCPPSLSDASIAAMVESDIVLLPTQPSSLDIRAGMDALRLAREARKMRQGKSMGIGLVPNRMARTRLGADLLTALVTMGEKVLPPISNRSVVAESAVSGLSCREASPKSPAAQEFAALAAGVEGMIAA
jgi:chromosome partitioning protein